MQVFRRFFPTLIVFLVRTLAVTLRFRVIDQSGVTRGDVKTPFIGIFWHNRLLMVPIIYGRYFVGRKGNCLTSPSKDGEIIAGVMERFGIGHVRGSSSRRGATAIRELAAILEKGEDVAITPDGPRGPRYKLHPGAVKLAQLTSIPILTTRIEYSHYWEMKSWDGFQIPKPFSRVSVTLDPLLMACSTSDDAAFEAERVRIEAALMSGPENASTFSK